MDFELNGHYIIIPRVLHESDTMLQARKRWLMSVPFCPNTFAERLRLSIFFHHVMFKGVTYPREIHNKLCL